MIRPSATGVKGTYNLEPRQGRIFVTRHVKDRSRLLIAAASLALVWTDVQAQKPASADVAAAMSGTWKLNRDLSDSLSAPGGGARRGGALFATASPVVQRGGRGGGGGGSSPTSSADLTPEELADQAAIRQLQAVPEVITIKAAPDSVSFSDARGERTYPATGKKITVDIGAAKVNVKTGWDKSSLKQEFSTPKANLTQVWQVDDRNHLVLKTKVESLTMVSREVKTIFDKQ
jgi:hypothetical protein